MLGEVLISKKILIGLVLIAIFGLVFVSLFFINQNSNLQNQLGEYQGQITKLQNQNSELEDRNSELENQMIQLQNQVSELQNLNGEQEAQLSKVTNIIKITRFTVSGPLNPIGGLLMASTANLTIHNFGINDVDGLTLSIKYNDVEALLEPLQLDTLRVGEELKISRGVYWGLSDTMYPFVARLMLGDVILDEYIVP